MILFFFSIYFLMYYRTPVLNLRRGLYARFATGEYSALFEIFLNHLPLSLPHYNYLRVTKQEYPF